MAEQDRERLRSIKTFPQLVAYLRDELDWPIDADDFDDLTFDYEPDELGIDAKTAAKIQEIKQLRPLVTNQPWGIFFVKFEPKQLPVVALRRILSRLALKKRASTRKADQAAWRLNDLLFISSYGQGDQRQISFAHFTQKPDASDLPTLKVLGWDDADTALHLDHTHHELKEKLAWPPDELALDEWHTVWSSAFTLRHREVITTSKDLAIRLADLARRIRSRANQVMAIETESGPIRRLHAAFRQALIHDLTTDGFADTYAQTISYGLLSTAFSRFSGDDEELNLSLKDMVALIPDTNPFLREMFQTLVDVGGRRNDLDFDELGVQDVVDVLNHAKMGHVLRDFDNRNPLEDPVIHFYELFLKEYDAERRMQRGVFYTPKPVVSYIVRSVHELLQTEFGLEDGLASTITWGEMIERHPEMRLPTVKVKHPKSSDLMDAPVDPQTPFVQILDPATGTATFLVEIIDVIYQTMRAKWLKAGQIDVAIPKLWNEYVPAHLLPRLYGYELLMAPYAIAHMKIGLKLFGTGYRFASKERARIYLTNALEPPRPFQSCFDIPALAHEAEAVNKVKREKTFTVVIGNPPYSKMSANLGEYAVNLIEPFRYVDGERIVERGALAHEINLQDDYVKFYGFMFRALSKTSVGVGSYISNFRYLDSGSLRGFRHHALRSFGRLSILHLGGHLADRNTISEPDDNVFDIEQGVAIALLSHGPALPIRGSEVRYHRLFGNRAEKYGILDATTMSGLKCETLSPGQPFYTFRPAAGSEETEFRAWSALDDLFPQNSGCVITSRDNLAIAFTPDELLEVIQRFANSRPADTQIEEQIGYSVKAKWDVEACKKLIRRQGVRRDLVRPILYRPFDKRYVYYLPQLLDTPSRPVSDLLVNRDNYVLLTPKVKTTHVFTHALVSRDTAEKKVCSHDRATQMFPMWTETLRGRSANVSGIRFRAGDNLDDPEAVLAYCYAILYSSGYRSRYGQVLREVFPHIPPAQTLTLLDSLVSFGEHLIGWHLLETPLVEHQVATYKGPSDPEVERVSYTPENRTVWLDTGRTRGFVGVGEAIWDFDIGGYKVCEKWLKDRQAKGGKNARPGRKLTDGDIAHYQKIVVALGETIKIMAQIDETIEAHGGWPGAFITDPKKLEGLRSKKA